jgi:hypothetical protein
LSVIFNVFNKSFISLLIPNIYKYWVLDLIFLVLSSHCNWIHLNVGYFAIYVIGFHNLLIINYFNWLVIYFLRNKFIIILSIRIFFREKSQMNFKLNYSPYFFGISFLNFISDSKFKMFFFLVVILFLNCKITNFGICYSKIITELKTIIIFV